MSMSKVMRRVIALLLAGLTAFGIALGPHLFSSVSADRKTGEDLAAEHQRLAELHKNQTNNDALDSLQTGDSAQDVIPGLVIVDSGKGSAAPDASLSRVDAAYRTFSGDAIDTWEAEQLLASPQNTIDDMTSPNPPSHSMFANTPVLKDEPGEGALADDPAAMTPDDGAEPTDDDPNEPAEDKAVYTFTEVDKQVYFTAVVDAHSGPDGQTGFPRESRRFPFQT